MPNVFFTADLHCGHRKILEMYKWRPYADAGDIEAHDNALIEQWNSTVSKHDIVYILGDLSLKSTYETRKILERLNGRKYLCPGNHDSSLKGLYNKYFDKVEQIMTVKFKKSIFPFLQEDAEFVLCHYPLAEWAGMHQGVYHLHGHCHGNIRSSDSRRTDVGIDATHRIIISLSEIVCHFADTCNAIQDNGIIGQK